MRRGRGRGRGRGMRRGSNYPYTISTYIID